MQCRLTNTTIHIKLKKSLLNRFILPIQKWILLDHAWQRSVSYWIFYWSLEYFNNKPKNGHRSKTLTSISVICFCLARLCHINQFLRILINTMPWILTILPFLNLRCPNCQNTKLVTFKHNFAYQILTSIENSSTTCLAIVIANLEMHFDCAKKAERWRLLALLLKSQIL